MASRLDLLPQRYCEELASMLDRYPPFPTDQAIAIIEQTTGLKLEEIFSEFDPEPIGSASIAVVYQARLRKNGLRVAVKVRRPGIRELFEADFRALDFLGLLAEALTLVRPGFTTHIRSEFRNVLASELDFLREARLGELFRRRARKAGKRFVSAPQVYFEYCSDEVIMQEFVSGIWMWEILAAVERGDPSGLARMRELNLDPKIIARRLLHIHYWSLYSHLSFHADPHPANIVVRANNDLVFVDFGASGSMNTMRKLLFRRAYESFARGDAATMAQCAIMLSEPLPPIDMNTVIKETEAAYYNHMIAVASTRPGTNAPARACLLPRSEFWRNTTSRRFRTF
jgi:ubiquinone biosynthesis protein